MVHPLWAWLNEPGNQQLLLGAIVAFGIGLTLGRWGLDSRRRNVKSSIKRGDKAFFKGIQYIISNDRDQAIEEFTKSVQLNSDTVETYVALGNLYRSRGDTDRAIRIRQSIILRPNIDEQIKLRALFDLGLDYRKGGFLNRAMRTFLEVAKRDPDNVEVLEETEKIYEELKDWENAYQVRKVIAQSSEGDHRHILAHYLVEMGKVCVRKDERSGAISYYNKAISAHKECVDAYLHLGDFHFSRGEYKKAISTWKKVVKLAPKLTFLAYRRLEGAYQEMKNLKPVEVFLKECAQSNPDAFTHLALARYLSNGNDIEGALEEITKALELNPTFWEARKLRGEILLLQGREEDVLSDYRSIIENLDIPYLRFQCTQCGFQPTDLQWQCPQCRKWDTIHLIDSAVLASMSSGKVEESPPMFSATVEEV